METECIELTDLKEEPIKFGKESIKFLKCSPLYFSVFPVIYTLVTCWVQLLLQLTKFKIMSSVYMQVIVMNQKLVPSSKWLITNIFLLLLDLYDVKESPREEIWSWK